MEANIPRNLSISTLRQPEKVMLVAVDAGSKETGKWSIDASLEELGALAKSAGAVVAGKLVQKIKAPSKQTYLGKGKVEELLALKNTLNYDTVIIDDELNPLQQKNLEESLQAKIIDRISLILDIFASRARTREGKLQVELAQYEYNLPRLAGKWSHLERLGAGIGTRGPGESQLETDKRIMRQRITRLKKSIEEISRQRDLYRKRRRRTGVPVVSLVGYTNAGKSTLLNALSHSEVLSKDELFSTLDPTVRRFTLPDSRKILLTDTVGFIRKLPPTLVTAFRATLEELNEADILLHVVNLSSQNAAEQCDTVEDILKELGVSDKPTITVLNKIDLLLDNTQKWTEEKAIEHIAAESGEPLPNTVLISATKRWGFDKLIEAIGSVLDKSGIETNKQSLINRHPEDISNNNQA